MSRSVITGGPVPGTGPGGVDRDTAPSRIRVAIVGECMLELGSDMLPTDMPAAYGGDTLNTATYLARLAGEGVSVEYVTALGMDSASEWMLARWRADGIDTRSVLLDPLRRPGRYQIQLDANGERRFRYWRDGSAARQLLRHPGFPAVADRLRAADCLYLSGISLAILPDEDRMRMLGVVQEARARGARIVFDSNYRPALWQDAGQARAWYARMLPYVDVALVTHDDEAALWGDANPDATLQRLTDSAARVVVVKLGAAGCVACRDGVIHPVAAGLVETVVDTTAAGDAFNGGFLAASLRGLDIVTCCEIGNRAAAIVIGQHGAIAERVLTEPLAAALRFGRDAA